MALDPESQATQPLLHEGTSGAAHEHWSRTMARSLYANATHLGTSMLLGLITGFCLKTIGQTIAVALVLLFLGFQVLAYYGFVNFNWRAIGSTVGTSLELTENGKFDMTRFRSKLVHFFTWMMSWGLLSVLGFLAGFYFGWKIL